MESSILLVLTIMSVYTAVFCAFWLGIFIYMKITLPEIISKGMIISLKASLACAVIFTLWDLIQTNNWHQSPWVPVILWASVFVACMSGIGMINGRDFGVIRIYFAVVVFIIGYACGAVNSDSEWRTAAEPIFKQRNMGHLAISATPRHLSHALDPCAVLDWRERGKLLTPECQKKESVGPKF